jgi:hypothetical protein
MVPSSVALLGGDLFGKNWNIVQNQGIVMAMGSLPFSPS